MAKIFAKCYQATMDSVTASHCLGELGINKRICFAAVRWKLLSLYPVMFYKLTDKSQ
ncbi:hypothetical protein OBBRIDRAFT_791630 [Obba rivulosa]|uniref:Uncharacterized protein n=1 Tax=Obba rivulosa TaxID=1052685 RepID=A0A8E2AW39_9APHY|nr:hypothetical protein OBBRIDRAFT_791630 [Obba rivulosa]